VQFYTVTLYCVVYRLAKKQEWEVRKSEVRKWGNGEMETRAEVGRQDRRTGCRARETMIYSTKRAIYWQGMERHDIMGNEVWLRALAVRGLS